MIRDQTEVAGHVLAVLLRRQGRANAIGAVQIARELGFTDGAERMIRTLIELHGNNDWPGILCSTPGVNGGYYFAQTDAEIAQHRAHLAALHKNAKAKLKRFDDRVKAEGFTLVVREMASRSIDVAERNQRRLAALEGAA